MLLNADFITYDIDEFLINVNPCLAAVAICEKAETPAKVAAIPYYIALAP